jgi:hypothetical protein
MKYREFAPARFSSPERLSTVTLYLAYQEEWQRLDHLRLSYGARCIAGRRDLSARYSGWPVDVLCASRDEAEQLPGG